MEEKVAILILAAGSSKRFGKPKQLLEYKGKTLIESAIINSSKANLGPVAVITGADSKKIEPVLKKNQEIVVIHNKDWKNGISSSIKTGLDFIRKKYPSIYGVIVLMADQPLITTEFIIDMVRSHYSFGKKIIASGYGGSYGVPVFYHKAIFSYLDRIEGDEGAKNIIGKLKQDVHVIPNPDAEFDIDTEEDYKKLLKLKR